MFDNEPTFESSISRNTSTTGFHLSSYQNILHHFPLVFNLKPQLLHDGEPPPLEPFSNSHFQLFSKFPLTLPSPSLPLPKCELTGAGACRRFKPSLGSKPPPTQKPPGLPRRRSCLRSHVPALVSPTCLVSPPSKPSLPST